MQPSRITLGQLMGIIAMIGVVFAVAPAPLAVALSVLLLVIGGISAFARVSWSRVAAWAFACYPLLLLASLHTTWLAAWYALGHPPRPSLDDPKFIGPLVDTPHIATWMLISGFLPALLVNVVLAAFEFIRTLHGEHDGLGRIAARVGLPLLSWPLALAWITADPGGVVYWFMD